MLLKGGLMTGYHTNIEEKTLSNSFFRQVLFTGRFCQLVVMSLKPQEEIDLETHPNVDQFFRIEAGEGKAILNGEEVLFKANDVLIVPAGTQHNIFNTSTTEDLKIYTLYSPPNHPDGTVHPTKAEAMAHEESQT